MKPKFNATYMDVAKRFAQLSYAKRLKVGAVIVKDDLMVPGYNGTPSGWDNNCEYKEYNLSRDINGDYFPGHEEEYPFEDEKGRFKLVTKSEVLHAEMNAISKMLKSGFSSKDAVLYVTHSPCINCAKTIYQAGISRVVFGQHYRSDEGTKFLKDSGVEVIQLDE